MSRNEEVPNRVLLEEIRINREEIRCVSDKVGGKVGRGELYSVLGTLAAIVGAVAIFFGV